MFIKTQDDNNLIEVSGSIKINSPVGGKYSVVMCNKLGYYILGEYDTQEYAKNALNIIALAISVNKGLLIMPESDFDNEKLITKATRVSQNPESVA